MKRQTKGERMLAKVSNYLLRCQVAYRTLGYFALADHYQDLRRNIIHPLWEELETERKRAEWQHLGIGIEPEHRMICLTPERVQYLEQLRKSNQG